MLSVLEDFVTVEDAAESLSVDKTRVTLLCRQGRFDGAIKMGGIWLIPREAVLNHKRFPPGPKRRTPSREDDTELLRAALAEAKGSGVCQE